MNTLTETLFTVLEAVGTVAFAVSGATVTTKGITKGANAALAAAEAMA